MYLQGVENVFDLVWTEWEEGGRTRRLTYRDVYHQNEVEQSTYNFEQSDTESLFRHFGDHEKGAKHLMDQQLALPAYEQVLKAAHTFNLLDARGAISVTERAAYIGRIRNLAKAVAQSYFESRERLGFPMLGGGRMSATLLVELLTEELPPKALGRLGESFASGIEAGLRKRGFLGDRSSATAYATPRRLAVSIADVRAATEPRTVEVKLMPVSVGLGADGLPTPALRKKLAASGLEGLGPREAQAAAGRQGRDPFRRGGCAFGRAGRGAPGRGRRGDRRAADPEGDELPARRRRDDGAVRAARARARGASWGRRRRDLGARPRRGPGHARAPLPGRPRPFARERAGLRGPAFGRGRRPARLRAAPRGHPRGPEGGRRARAIVPGAGGRVRRAPGRGDGARRDAGRVRGPLRARVPRRAAGMPHPHDAPEPEVFPAVRRGRGAHGEVPRRLEPASGRSFPHRPGQRARGAPEARGCALLLRHRPQDEARRARAAARDHRLPRQARHASSSASSACASSPRASS